MTKTARNDAMIADYNGGMLIVDIAQKYGLNAPDVCAIFKRRCVPRRSMKESLHLSPKYVAMLSRWKDERERKASVVKEVGYLELDPFWLEDSGDKFYLIGYLYADGNVAQDGDVTISSRDVSHIEQIGAILNRKVSVSARGGKEMARISLGGQRLAKYLLGYGLYPAKSLTVKFPKNIPDQYMGDFIRGVFDGDGHISIRDRGMKGLSPVFGFSSGSADFVEGLSRVLFYFCGIQMKPRWVKTEWGSVIQLTAYGILKCVTFREFIYSDGCLCLARKMDKFSQFVKPIKLISKDGVEYWSSPGARSAGKNKTQA